MRQYRTTNRQEQPRKLLMPRRLRRRTCGPISGFSSQERSCKESRDQRETGVLPDES